MSTPVPRSLFVSATAWSLIVLGLLGVVLAALVWMLATLLSTIGIEQVYDENPLFGLLPPTLQWMMRHLGWVALFGTSVAALPLGMALHRRREWARVASIWTCWLLALLHAVVVPWQWQQVAAWRGAIDFTLPVFVRDQIMTMYWPIQIVSALTTLMLAAAFGWTAWRLAQPEIRAEFISGTLLGHQ